MNKLILVMLILSVLLCGCSKDNPTTDGEDPDVAQDTPAADTKDAASEDAAPETEPEIDLDEYKSLVGEFRANVYDASVILMNMGNYEASFMKALGSTSDTLVDDAFEWLEKKSDNTKASFEALDESVAAQFGEILEMTKGDAAQLIFAQVNTLYTDYTALYDTVTTVPYSVSAFTSEFNEAMSAVKDDLKILDATVPAE